MNFIRESWYIAGWAGEIAEKPVGRRLLNEEVVLYRTSGGEAAALAGVCPHRFASLAKGRVHGDSITCPYHGLSFGPDGHCTQNPHGPIAAAIRVKRYPLLERHGMLWIWMGAGEPDMAMLPDTTVLDQPGITWINGALHVQANYQLIIDNLLDLTHVEFMHPFLFARKEGHDDPLHYQARQDGDHVVSMYNRAATPPAPIVRAIWNDAPDTIRLWSHMRWSPAASLYLDTGFAPVGTAGTEGALLLPTYHLLTPETAATTHYFWWAECNVQLGDEAVSGRLRAGFEATFKFEDEPMVADIQARIGDLDLMELRPLLLSLDNAAVRARRIVEKKVKAEQENQPVSALTESRAGIC